MWKTLKKTNETIVLRVCFIFEWQQWTIDKSWMWISNRCAKWCYKSRCSITNIERSRRSNAIMLRKWSSNYDRSGVRSNSLFVSIWFSATGVVWLFSHTNGWRQRLRCTLSINRSKSLSINWCGQFGFLFTIGELNNKLLWITFLYILQLAKIFTIYKLLWFGLVWFDFIYTNCTALHCSAMYNCTMYVTVCM